MYCPFCQATETKVLDSRLLLEGTQVRRRRECTNCQQRFTTYEAVELQMPRVVKRDGTRVSFSEDKVRNGLLRALEKRPVSTEAVDEAMMKIIKQVRAQGDKEVSSEKIGGWVMEQLHKLDDVAYVRFASVYRRFQDLEAFKSEIEKLIKN